MDGWFDGWMDGWMDGWILVTFHAIKVLTFLREAGVQGRSIFVLRAIFLTLVPSAKPLAQSWLKQANRALTDLSRPACPNSEHPAPAHHRQTSTFTFFLAC